MQVKENLKENTCEFCGKVEADASKGTMKLCSGCRVSLSTYPIPHWIKVSAIVTAAILCWSLISFPKTVEAGIAFERGQKLESKGNYAAASLKYKIVADRFPDSMLVLSRLGISLQKSGSTKEAIITLSKLEGREDDAELVDEVNATLDSIDKEAALLEKVLATEESKLNKLEKQCDVLDKSVTLKDRKLGEMEKKLAQMDKDEKQGKRIDTGLYDRLVDEHNALIPSYDAERKNLDKLNKQFEENRKVFNKMVDNFNDKYQRK